LLKYISEFRDLLKNFDETSITKAFNFIESARVNRNVVYLIGNGGSATMAEHMATDLIKNSYHLSPPIRALSLVSSISNITAFANDANFENVFELQLNSLAQESDLLIIFSASGNSKNLIKAVDVAKDKGLKTISIVGFDGGKLLNQSDLCVHLPTKIGAYGFSEDFHSIVNHAIAGMFKRQL
jgi:phosphoheptose isomerase